MSISADKLRDISFLQGGGEMGRLIRSKDWNRTPLGDVSGWPQSLRTTLSIILRSKFPMFLFWGPDLICFYNDAYRPSLGNEGKHPAILGVKGVEAWAEIWHIIKPLIDQVMNEGEATWSEDQFIPIYRNGTIEKVYWTFSYSPVIDESGKVAGVFVTCMETTSKVLTQAEQSASRKLLEEAEKKFRNLVINAPVPTAVFKGENMVIELANDEVLKLWKKDSSVIGKPILQAIPEMLGQPFFAIMQEVYRTGNPWEGKRVPAFVEKNGIIKEGYYNLLYKALYNNDNVITGIICMGYEVTDQVLHEQQKDDFIKMASHELKTPVTTVKGYIQLLLAKYADTNDPVLAGSLAVIEKQISKLGKLLTDLLDVNKIETGRFLLKKEMFLVETLINDIVDDFRITATHIIEVGCCPGIYIYADKDRITQVLLNLLANAIKYSPNSDKVIIKTKQEGENVIITVQDFGIGIAPREHENIFDRFYRVHAEGEKTFPGFGIGLFIVKEIVELHDGKVWVESETGVGSSFHVMLPAV